MELITILPLLSISTLAAVVFRRIGYPSVVGFVIGGVASYYLYIFVRVDPISLLNDPVLQILSQIGLILLGFEIGTEFNIKILRSVVRNASALEMGSMIIIWLIWSIIAHVMRIDLFHQIILFLITINTSTGVLYRILREFHEISDREYRLLLSASSIEDIVAVLGLSILIGIGSGATISFNDFILFIGKLTVIILSLLYIGIFFIEKITKDILREIEYLALFTLALAITYSVIAGLTGFSVLLGSFLAGVVIGSTLDPKPLTSYLSILRELGLLFYFSLTGLYIPVSFYTGSLDISILFIMMIISMLVMLIKYVGFSTSLWFQGVDLEHALKTGLYMTVISEFGIIISRELYTLNILPIYFITLSSVIFLFSSTISGLLISKKEILSRNIIKLVPQPFREFKTQIFIQRSSGRFSGMLNIFIEYVLSIFIFISATEYIRTLVESFYHESKYLYLGVGILGTSSLLWIITLIFIRFINRRITDSEDTYLRKKAYQIITMIRAFTISIILILATIFQIRLLTLLEKEFFTTQLIWMIRASEIIIIVIISIVLYRLIKKSYRYRS